MGKKKINYVIAFYAGPRRHYGNSSPCLKFIKKHIEWLKTSPTGIDRATFFFNEVKNESERETIEYLNEHKHQLPMEVFDGIRENTGMSYGIWQDVLSNTKNEFDYTFTIEDDYCPIGKDVMLDFESKVFDDTIFVASYYKDNYNGHAAISNGLIVNKHINQSQPFTIVADNSYPGGGIFNQTQYLRQYQDKGLKIEDITDIGYVEFLDVKRGMNRFGDLSKPLLIKPISIE
jgi:hypothetical protein